MKNHFNTIALCDQKITIATLITLLRIILTPFIMQAIFYHEWSMALLLFIIAGITDILDGVIARSLQQATLVGAIADPVADKILMLSVFFSLTTTQTTFAIPWWFFIVMCAKEIMLIGGFLFFYSIKSSFLLDPSGFGKSAMLAQWLCIILILCGHIIWIPLFLYYMMLFAVLLLQGLSLLYYGRRALHPSSLKTTT